MSQISKSSCKALTKAGEPCRAAATAGGLCFLHANPNKASELGRIGGRKNRQTYGSNTDPLPALDNALALRETVARLISEVYANKVSPRQVAGLASLLSLQLRTIEMADVSKMAHLEQRIAQLEKASAQPVEPAAANGGQPLARGDIEKSVQP